MREFLACILLAAAEGLLMLFENRLDELPKLTEEQAREIERVLKLSREEFLEYLTPEKRTDYLDWEKKSNEACERIKENIERSARLGDGDLQIYINTR